MKWTEHFSKYWKSRRESPIRFLDLAIIAVFVASIFSVRSCYQELKQLRDTGNALVTAQAPRGLKSFSLASNKELFRTVYQDWRKNNLLDRAKAVIDLDRRFVPIYGRCFLLLATFGWLLIYFWRSPSASSLTDWIRIGIHWYLLAIAIGVSAALDNKENYYFERLLIDPALGELSRLRFYAQAKFITIAFLLSGIVITLLAAIRREIRFWQRITNPIEPNRVEVEKRGLHFSDLIVAESKGFSDSERTSQTVIELGPAGEPKVSWCTQDLVGLALSGGGIRSATFNLGVLQGLYRIDLLRHVHYLATVSGGGYIGGFWSRWLKEREASGESESMPEFPDTFKQSARDPTAKGISEADQIRHIREFGKFLIPRTGIFDTETWGAAVAVLAGVIPAIFAALSVLA